MRGLIYCIIICFFAVDSFAQSPDSVAYSKNFILNEGLYLSYSDLRHNWPIPKEKILTKIDKNQLDFYAKLLEYDEIEYLERDGNVAKINSSKVWGFCQNNVIYINYNKTFFRIPVFGSISYFVAEVNVASFNPGYNVFINSSGGTSSNSKEIRDFIFEFYSGRLSEFSLDLLEELLKKDVQLYKEFAALSKKKKKENTSKFIRKFNEKHPVYFPRN